MALFFECIQECARKVLDTGRHCQRGDLSTVILARMVSADYNFTSPRFLAGGPIWPLTLRG